MPDDAKFKKLREVGYSIRENCGFCKHSDFTSGMWGWCSLHTYVLGRIHGGVSVVQIGSCDQFEEDPTKLAWLDLGAHSEFLPGRIPKELPASKGRKQRSK